jgi:hypothetical protein
LGDIAWQGMLKTPELKHASPALRAALKPFFDTLQIDANAKADYKTLLEVQKAYIAWVQGNGVLEKAIAGTPASQRLPLMNLQMRLRVLTPLIDDVLRDIPASLKRRRLLEFGAIACRVSYTQVLHFQAGTLTLGELCREEPWSLFCFDRP